MDVPAEVGLDGEVDPRMRRLLSGLLVVQTFEVTNVVREGAGVVARGKAVLVAIGCTALSGFFRSDRNPAAADGVSDGRMQTQVVVAG